jgi:sugar phosphate isomerase/epimerase
MSRVALQLYTVRDDCAQDLAGVLARTAALGFEGVELHDLYGHSAEEFRHLLDENGLVACGCHTGVARVEDELEQVAAEYRTLGMDRLVVPWIETPQTAVEADAACERLVAGAKRTADVGLRFGFHNHDGELRVLEDGRTVLDRLLDVPAELLFLEVDLGWVWYAGGDPMEFAEQLGGRAPLLHVKDLQRDVDGAAVHVPLGDGDLDYTGFADVVARAGTEWLVVEQDESDGPSFEAVESSVAVLRQLLEG